MKVLELGVGDASLTRRLSQKGAQVDGYELDVGSVHLARPFCRRVYEGDLDLIDDMPLDRDYDLVMAADVLEHLRDPERVLSRLKATVKKNGILIVSLPNVANIYVRLNLLLGRFPYHSKGILDRTHLHFYTIKSARQMLNKTGWVIEGAQTSTIPLVIIFPPLNRWPFKLFLYMLRGATSLFKGLMAYQSVFICRNPNQHQLL